MASQAARFAARKRSPHTSSPACGPAATESLPPAHGGHRVRRHRARPPTPPRRRPGRRSSIRSRCSMGSLQPCSAMSQRSQPGWAPRYRSQALEVGVPPSWRMRSGAADEPAHRLQRRGTPRSRRRQRGQPEASRPLEEAQLTRSFRQQRKAQPRREVEPGPLARLAVNGSQPARRRGACAWPVESTDRASRFPPERGASRGKWILGERGLG